jgi:hypothetical protein
MDLCTRSYGHQWGRSEMILREHPTSLADSMARRVVDGIHWNTTQERRPHSQRADHTTTRHVSVCAVLWTHRKKRCYRIPSLCRTAFSLIQLDGLFPTCSPRWSPTCRQGSDGINAVLISLLCRKAGDVIVGGIN